MSSHSIKRIPAYAAIYLLWGGAYLAVRVLVREFPPFLVAGLRYCLAAACLVPIILSQRGPAPRRRQVINAVWTGSLMLAAGYGIVFWAEQRLSSWLAAVLVSTSFLWTYLGECFVLRSFRFRPAMLAPLLVGLAGLPLLFEGGGYRGGVSFLAALAVLAGCTSVHSDNEPIQAVSAGDGRPFGGAPAVDIPRWVVAYRSRATDR